MAPSFAFQHMITQDDITMRASLKPELISQDGATIQIEATNDEKTEIFPQKGNFEIASPTFES